MAQVKGKFITLTGSLMALYKVARDEADAGLIKNTGKHYDELDPEGWYECQHFIDFMNKYVTASAAKEKALLTLGRQIYPTIQRSVGFPPDVKTPLDLILFEAEGFLMNHRGAEIRPRTFIRKAQGHVIVQAPSPGYPTMLQEGVFLGILEMSGAKDGRVTLLKGSPECEFEIVW